MKQEHGRATEFYDQHDKPNKLQTIELAVDSDGPPLRSLRRMR